jgi:putative transposase
VERNALRANLVEQAQDWRWCSLWRKLNSDRESLLSAWPLDRLENWLAWVNEAQTDAEVEALRMCVNRGTPYGSKNWTNQIADALGLKYTLQPRGTPRKVLGLTDNANVNMFASPFHPPQ